MIIDENNWLPHLKYLPKDIKGYKTCTYLMALEGWRRGLTLKFRIRPRGRAIPPSIRFTLSNGEKEHYFTVARGDKVEKSAINICMNKPLAYKHLAKSNVPIPEGSNFGKDVNDEDIIRYAKKIGFPLVIKPTDGSSGRGVITDIKNIDDFKSALTYVRDDLNFKKVIVERFFVGEDYRIYVIGNKVIGAHKRVSANVIGDGEHTIKELINIKNEQRKKNPFIENRPIKIDENLKEFLDDKNLTLSSIPNPGERVFLRRQGAYLKERDPVDITDKLPEKIKEIAIKATQAIPGLNHCAVDMLVNESTGEGVVNEVNSRPQISNHLFPLEGQARDIPAEIIDYYFPETKEVKRNNLFYYDFNPVYNAFLEGNATEVRIPKIPSHHAISSRFLLTGSLRGVNYERWIRRHVKRLRLHGYLKHLKNDRTSIVVSGSPKSIETFRNIITNQSPSKATVNKVIEKRWEKPVKIGFEIKKPSAKSEFTQLKDVKDSYNKLKNKYEKLQKDYKKLRTKYNANLREYESIQSSTSWKITKPIRKISSIGKHFK